MKVVLFCGGLGMRMREYSEALPKPMVPIGYRPILWHVMKYYAHYGHKDFILCLGYRGDTIKKYFLEYNECVSNDFVLSQGGKGVELLGSDIQDWRITFVDTGLTSNIGKRLKAVEKHLTGEDLFLANYSDGLSDMDLGAVIDTLRQSDGVACFASVLPNASFHVVETDRDGRVQHIEHVRRTGARINGGFFAFRREIFQYLKDGEDLVEEPFHRLIAAGKLVTYRHDGYWACMDTFKEKMELDDVFAQGRPPWAVWSEVR
jgi:glucose-1-phosphate cytidylyltransferase